MSRWIPIEQMPKTYQKQYPRAVRELVRDARESIEELRDDPRLREEFPKTEQGLKSLLAELSFEIADRRIGAYHPDSTDERVERHNDWRTHVENAAAAQVRDEWLRG